MLAGSRGAKLESALDWMGEDEKLISSESTGDAGDRVAVILKAGGKHGHQVQLKCDR